MDESLSDDVEKATSLLGALKKAGKVTSLKTEKSFVGALVESEKASAVIRGIVGLARWLGINHRGRRRMSTPGRRVEGGPVRCDSEICGRLPVRLSQAVADFMLRLS